MLLLGFPCRTASQHWCWVQAVLPPCPGCRDPASRAGLCSGFHIHGKQLGFHLSKFMNKLTRSRSSWPGLCHTLAGPWSLLPASRGCCAWGAGNTGRCSALQKAPGWGCCSGEPSERFSSHKDPFPSVLTAERCLVTSSALAWCITLPEVSPSDKGWRPPQALQDLEKAARGKGEEWDRSRRCYSNFELCGESSRAGSHPLVIWRGLA